MKVLCKKTLYLHQEQGYSGWLTAQPIHDGKKGKVIFKAGEECEIVVMPFSGTLESICVYAKGQDGKLYRILNDGLHWNVTRFACTNFDFSGAVLGAEVAKHVSPSNL